MCRVFIFAKANNDHPDPSLDWTRFKRGDVVEVLEDGKFGGQSVETDPLFYIVEVPGVPVSDLVALKLGREDPTGEFYPQLTTNRLDLDALIADHGNMQLTREELLVYRKTLPQVRRR